MMKRYKILFLALTALLAACSTDEDVFSANDDALEMKGIQVAIAGEESLITRAATIDPLKVSVGRTKFVGDDEIVFTTIKRTKGPLKEFTYSNIHYQYNGTNWERTPNGTNDDPEKIYWTDGHSDHTFIAYNLPKGYQWETETNSVGNSTYDTYAGELGKGKDVIV